MKNLLYFFYYLKITNYERLRRFFSYVKIKFNVASCFLFYDIIVSTFRYKISLLDYFYFRFYDLSEEERKKWAGTSFMYEYQLHMNPRGARELLVNKHRFLQHFSPFVKRGFASLQELKANPALAESLLANASGRLVLKGSRGQVGAEVEVAPCEGLNQKKLIEMLQSRGYHLVEEYVIQHPALMELSPSGLNTLRIFTQLYKGQVDFLGARLRVSVNSAVDNMAAGNLAAPVDLETGCVKGTGVYSDITKTDEAIHPITGMAIVGFQIPFWHEALDMVRQAALHTPENRSVGWDIAITPSGPELIEGNHNWCKLLWQLPVKQGLKPMLDKYLDNK